MDLKKSCLTEPVCHEKMVGQRIPIRNIEAGVGPFAMNLKFQAATAQDAARLASLHITVAEHLTRLHGFGPWSSKTSEAGVLYAMRNSQVFFVRDGDEIVATLRLATKKPWAIDQSYFTACQRPLYLLAMAVTPARQHQGIGRWCLEKARQAAKAWPADAIRLDAYDHAAGAGGFYARCGFIEVGRARYRNVPLIYYECLILGKQPS
jgi:GNAT superfamily N-acetyltransferase